MSDSRASRKHLVVGSCAIRAIGARGSGASLSVSISFCNYPDFPLVDGLQSMAICSRESLYVVFMTKHLPAKHTENFGDMLLLLLLLLPVFSFKLILVSLSCSGIYLLLPQPLRTYPPLDAANFRGHRLTYMP